MDSRATRGCMTPYHEASHMAASTCNGSASMEPSTRVCTGELWAFAMLHVHVGCVCMGAPRSTRASA